MVAKHVKSTQRKLFGAITLWLILLLPVLCYSKDDVKTTNRPQLFNSLKDTTEANRVEAARAVYRINCRKMNEADAMRCLDDLKGVAIQLNDLQLQCAIFDMRADYYSVNRGYNSKSSAYFDDAIAFAQHEDMQLETGIYQHRKANYLFLYKQNTAACRYYLLSEENLREFGFSRVPDVGNLFSESANFYYSVGDFDNARQNLKNALKYQTKTIRTRINILNTIGLTYRNEGKYTVAEKYFDKALNMAGAAKDTAWVAITRGNIGSVYFMQHLYAKALPLVEADYRQSLKYKQVLNAAIALLRIVRINTDYGNIKLANRQLDTAGVLLSKCDVDVLTHMVQYYDLKATLSERFNHTAAATLYRDRSEQLRDSVTKRDNIAAIERVRMQWVIEKSRTEFNSLKKSAQINTLKQNMVILVLVLLIVITILVYNHRMLKIKKDKAVMELEKRQLDEDLQNATLALHGYTENLTQKNILIDEFKTELEKVQEKYSDKNVALNLDKMMQAHIMTEENWDEFKKLFSRVHATFFYNLRHNYNNLSGTDIRLLALIKLKLNNKEMAGMLGITVDGIKKAKQRLRKKMEIPDRQEFEEITNAL